jgi:aminoglycoside phosphotransferase
VSDTSAPARVISALAAQGIDATPFPMGKGLFRAGDLLLKTWRPDQADKAMAQAQRQAEVAQALTTGARAPRVLFFDAQRLVLAMPYLTGADLSARWRAGHHDVPEHAGAWLRAFHALTARDAPFWPKGQVNWLNRLVDAGQSGTREIVEFDRFRAAAMQVQARAKHARGKPCRKAVTHRDMTLSNLIRADGQTWGIDFENPKPDDALRDVFTLALDLAAMAPERTQSALPALRRAYGDTVTAPEVRLFLQQCFCLWVWANTPAQPSARQAARLDCAEAWLAAQEPVI